MLHFPKKTSRKKKHGNAIGNTEIPPLPVWDTSHLPAEAMVAEMPLNPATRTVATLDSWIE